MTAKNTAEKEKKQVQNQQSLHGTLSKVVPQNLPPRPPPPTPQQAQPVAPTPEPAKKGPYEVPEDTLRKVLKGEV
jgi:hypothetical protein